eukprot:7753229-Pyramimonas_sp.AAC.1
MLSAYHRASVGYTRQEPLLRVGGARDARVGEDRADLPRAPTLPAEKTAPLCHGRPPGTSPPGSCSRRTFPCPSPSAPPDPGALPSLGPEVRPLLLSSSLCQ